MTRGDGLPPYAFQPHRTRNLLLRPHFWALQTKFSGKKFVINFYCVFVVFIKKVGGGCLQCKFSFSEPRSSCSVFISLIPNKVHQF